MRTSTLVGCRGRRSGSTEVGVRSPQAAARDARPAADIAKQAGEEAAGAARKAAVSGTGYEHVVKEGETLSAIAAAYKVKPAAIIEANDLANPNALRAGQKLFIPK